MNGIKPNGKSQKRNIAFPSWAPLLGVIFGGITIAFFMALILLSIFNWSIPDSSRFLIVAVLALGVALALAFIGGDAAARGKIPIPYLNNNPTEFSVAGGVGIFIIVLILGIMVYPEKQSGIITLQEGDNDVRQEEYVTLQLNTWEISDYSRIMVYDENGQNFSQNLTPTGKYLYIIRIPRNKVIILNVMTEGNNVYKKKIIVDENRVIEFRRNPIIPNFDQQAFLNATSLKDEADTLMEKARYQFADHADEVRDFMNRVNAAYEYVRGIQNNEDSAEQWRILKNREGPLLGGFFRLWEKNGTLLSGDLKAIKGNVMEGFDEIISLESSKTRE